MKLKKFKEHYSLVILTTEDFFQYINSDNRKTLLEQIEMDFRSDDKTNIAHPVFYNEIKMIDYKKRDAILKSLKTLLLPLINYLNKNLHGYLFHDSLGSANSDPSNPYNIINRYHIKACKLDGTLMLKKDFKIIQDEMIKIFIEANRLITIINKIGEDETVLSLILTKLKDHRINPIIYNNVAASYIVYELFNFKKSTPQLPLSFNIGLVKPITLISPQLKYHEAILEKTQLVDPAKISQHGNISDGLLDIEGPYFDDNIISLDTFNERVYCKDTGDNKDESARIYDFLLNNTNKENFLVAIRPSQPYLCHEGINAKKYKVIGLQKRT